MNQTDESRARRACAYSATGRIRSIELCVHKETMVVTPDECVAIDIHNLEKRDGDLVIVGHPGTFAHHGLTGGEAVDMPVMVFCRQFANHVSIDLGDPVIWRV